MKRCKIVNYRHGNIYFKDYLKIVVTLQAVVRATDHAVSSAFRSAVFLL